MLGPRRCWAHRVEYAESVFLGNTKTSVNFLSRGAGDLA